MFGFLSVDPLTASYPMLTPYQFASNGPIRNIDLDGLESVAYQDLIKIRGDETVDQTVGKLLGNVLIGAGNTAAFLFNGADAFIKNGPSGTLKEWNQFYNIQAKNIAQDMINAHQSGEHTNGYDYVSDRLDDPEVLAAGFGSGMVLRTITPTTTQVRPFNSGDVIQGTTLYRGVNNSSPGYTNATQGTVKPRGGVNGHSNTLEHNTGVNGTANSSMTSWTTDVEVARNYASRPNGNGVVLERRFNNGSLIKSPNKKDVSLKQKPGTVVSESEVLIKGDVKGANVTKIKPQN